MIRVELLTRSLDSLRFAMKYLMPYTMAVIKATAMDMEYCMAMTTYSIK
jgi:hypothetical protein